MKGSESAAEIYENEQEEMVALEPIISFPIHDQQYAIPIGSVKEVIKCPEITTLPQLPDQLKGLVNVRGNVFVVVDLALIFGLQETASDYSYLIILDLDHHAVALGVTAVPNTIHVNMDKLQKVQNNSNEKGLLESHLRGFLKYEDDLIALMDIDQLISSDAFSKFIF